MCSPRNKDPAQVRRDRLNALVLFLPGQWLGLMVLYWARFCPPFRPFAFEVAAPAPALFVAACALACTPFVFPRGYFNPRAFETRRLYGALGLRWFRHLTTDGELVNAQVRRIEPGYRVVRDRKTLRDHLKGTYSNERWHLSFFLAGTFTALHAAWTEQYVWCALIASTNVVFNLYPVLHQRSKRARSRRLLRRTMTA